MKAVSRVSKSSRKTIKIGKSKFSKIVSCSPEKKKEVNANRERLAKKRSFFKKVATKYHKEMALLTVSGKLSYYQAVSSIIKAKGL